MPKVEATMASHIWWPLSQELRLGMFESWSASSIFTKWVELIPLPSKSSKDSARGILEGVLNRYGAPGEILTNQGREFIGEF